jgi:hypothetical protein
MANSKNPFHGWCIERLRCRSAKRLSGLAIISANFVIHNLNSNTMIGSIPLIFIPAGHSEPKTSAPASSSATKFLHEQWN